jgi:hypothetical protein
MSKQDGTMNSFLNYLLFIFIIYSRPRTRLDIVTSYQTGFACIMDVYNSFLNYFLFIFIIYSRARTCLDNITSYQTIFVCIMNMFIFQI